MDVSFIDSGALSRAHYSLVRKAESAQSPQAADQIHLSEIDGIRHLFAVGGVSLKECREKLIMLLYCSMNLTHVHPGELAFALPHAVNLAEMGQTLHDKQLGFVFCTEVMPPNHELQLMLVNTIRKDLGSSSTARVCLALSVLIQMPNDEVIPAVQSQLQALFMHKSISVRRRAYLAYYSLLHNDPSRLTPLEDAVVLRIQRTLPSIDSCAMAVAMKLNQVDSINDEVNALLPIVWQRPGRQSQCLTLLVLRALRKARLSMPNVGIVLEIIKRTSSPPVRVLLREAFLVLSSVSAEAIQECQMQQSLSLVACIRRLLTSKDPNDQYLFVSCLDCLSPTLWAGTLPGTVAALDEWEVQEVMKLLDSHDRLVRKITLRVLQTVDASLVKAYSTQLLHNFPAGLTLSDKGEYVSRLLDVGVLQYGDDGEQYARYLKELFAVAEGDTQGRTEDMSVIEVGVEMILTHIREFNIMCRISCVTALAVSVTESGARIGPTLMVVISALACEYCGKIATSPLSILQGMASRLVSYGVTVQDACLLTMLRLSAECDQIPHTILKLIAEISQFSGKRIRNRCSLFLTYCAQRNVLAGIIAQAPSSSLPDFLVALTTYGSNTGASAPIDLKISELSPGSPPRTSLSPRKLRYEAYGTPQAVPSLRHLSSPRRNEGIISSLGSRTRSSSRASERGMSSELARTITPGELTIAAAQGSLQDLPKLDYIRNSDAPPNEDLASRIDLISLDTASSEVPVGFLAPEPDFEDVWDAMENSNLRGWCESSMDNVVRLLQSLQHSMRVIAVDQPPFEDGIMLRSIFVPARLVGELKVLVVASPLVEPKQGAAPPLVEPKQGAALRLRESEEESCLWRLRCDDLELRTTIKRLLEDI
ncbi:armadillo-type protein [Suillus bovinus]|uniref:armadillo-type protein n=1 Tax=Suillus bovinus TaxID=48563 RepID=UPI001B8721BF|nr:armadillo-type protein [Suillus bovinus]KAG2146464.1 armadillo-type protein [Suillus bovinus]